MFIIVWNEWFGWIHMIWYWKGRTLLLSFHEFIFPHPSMIIWPMCLCHLDCALFIQSNNLFPPIHVVLSWYIGRTTCYKDIPLLTCHIKYWRQFPRTKACSPFLLTIKRLTIVADYWCNIPVTLVLPSLPLLWNVIVYGCNVCWT